MGIFSVTVGVGHKDGGELRDAELMVDTGASYTVLPSRFLASLNVETPWHRVVGFANNAQEVWPLGFVRIAYNDEELICPVLAGPDDMFLLGATTLEIFSLGVDPVHRELVPTPLKGRPL